MARLIFGLTVLMMLWWLFSRLWPAFRTEPATWLGDDWRENTREKIGAKIGL